VVKQAAILILEPLLTPLVSDPASGPSAGPDRLQTLALAERSLKEGRPYWATAMVKAPFANVSLPALARIVQRHLCDEELVQFVMRALSSGKGKGIHRLSALSALFLDLYLYDLIDRPWRKRHPDRPLLRAGEELLLPCASRAEARGAGAKLAALLADAGIPLRGGRVSAPVEVGEEPRATWLGFEIEMVNKSARYFAADSAYEHLAIYLSLACEAADPLVQAERVIERWGMRMGPCHVWQHNRSNELYKRVKAIAGGLGLKRFPVKPRFVRYWESGWAHWKELRETFSPARST
jgi:hypothetical protein